MGWSGYPSLKDTWESWDSTRQPAQMGTVTDLKVLPQKDF